MCSTKKHTLKDLTSLTFSSRHTRNGGEILSHINERKPLRSSRNSYFPLRLKLITTINPTTKTQAYPISSQYDKRHSLTPHDCKPAGNYPTDFLFSHPHLH